MLNKLTRSLVAVSRTWWLVALTFVLNIISFQVLFALEDRFEALTGAPVLDTQNGLTIVTLLEQLPLYRGAAYGAYLRFAAFDFVFPFVSALFLAVLWALLLRWNGGRIAQRLLSWNLPLLPFLATLFDWLENVSVLLVLGTASPPGQLLHAVIVCKRLKLTSLTVIMAITILLHVLLLGYKLAELRRKAARPTAPR